MSGFKKILKKCLTPELLEECLGWRCEEVAVVTGWATVTAQGEIFASCGNPVIERAIDPDTGQVSVGLFNVTPPAGSVTAIPHVIVDPDSNNGDGGIRDDIQIHMGTSFTGGTISVYEGDNGAAPGTPRANPWSITWFGKEKRIICD